MSVTHVVFVSVCLELKYATSKEYLIKAQRFKM